MEFEQKETPTIMSGRVVRWEGKVSWRNFPEISASRDGVLISGAWPILNSEGIDVVKATLDLAVAEYIAMKR